MSPRVRWGDEDVDDLEARVSDLEAELERIARRHMRADRRRKGNGNGRSSMLAAVGTLLVGIAAFLGAVFSIGGGP